MNSIRRRRVLLLSRTVLTTPSAIKRLARVPLSTRISSPEQRSLTWRAFVSLIRSAPIATFTKSKHITSHHSFLSLSSLVLILKIFNSHCLISLVIVPSQWVISMRFRGMVSVRQVLTHLSAWTRPPSWIKSWRSSSSRCTCSSSRCSSRRISRFDQLWSIVRIKKTITNSTLIRSQMVESMTMNRLRLR